MSISVVCAGCGKRFNVADQFAGKRGKCKSCGAAIEIPRAGLPKSPEVDDLPDLAALGDLDRSARASVAPPPPLYSTPAPVALPYATPVYRAEAERRATAPLSDFVADQLPLGLVVLGYVLPTGYMVVKGLFGPAPGESLAMNALWAVGCLGIVAPLTGLGVKLSAMAVKYETPTSPALRGMAAFAAVPIMVMIFNILAQAAVASSTPGTDVVGAALGLEFIGLVLGVVVSFFLVWMLFGLRFPEALVTWLFSGFGYVAGATVAGLLSVGIVLYSLNLTGRSPGIGISGSPMVNNTTGMPGLSQPGQQATAPRPPTVASLRSKSGAKVYQLAQALGSYQARHGQYPTDLVTAVNEAGLGSDALQSPFPHSAAGTDYYYRYSAALTPNMRSVIIVYDQAELEHDTNVEFARVDGSVTGATLDGFKAYLTMSDQAFAAEQKRSEQANAAALAAASRGPGQRGRAGGANPGAAGVPNGNTQPGAPLNDDPNAQPVTLGWKASPDGPSTRPSVKENVLLAPPFPSTDVLYSVQNTAIVGVGNDFGAAGADSDIHDCWNLQTYKQVGRITGAVGMKAPVISPDGQSIAGLVSGGVGAATVYDVWSFKTGKEVQSLAGPAETSGPDPAVIGFLGGDALLTLSDKLDVWDIKSGSLTREIDLKATRGANDVVAVSAGGKLVAILDSGNKVGLYDTVDGTFLGFNALSAQAPGARRSVMFNRNARRGLAFSPDGTELAVYLPGPGNIVADWSVADGSLVASFTPPATNFGRPLNQKAGVLSWLMDGSGWLLGDQ
jgi:hypothetical protein